MTTRQNLQFRLGETWTITLDCADALGAALDLTGGNVRVRIASFDRSTLFLDLSITNGVVLADPAHGVAACLVTAAMQTAAQMTPGPYRYDAVAVLADGTSSDQASGLLTVADSLFADFP